MTTSVTPLIKPEERQVHVHLSLQEASTLQLALNSTTSTMKLPEDWEKLFTELAGDIKNGIDMITR